MFLRDIVQTSTSAEALLQFLAAHPVAALAALFIVTSRIRRLKAKLKSLLRDLGDLVESWYGFLTRCRQSKRNYEDSALPRSFAVPRPSRLFQVHT
jgi:hypothetical protein